MVIGGLQYNAVVKCMQCPHAQPLHRIMLTYTAAADVLYNKQCNHCPSHLTGLTLTCVNFITE